MDMKKIILLSVFSIITIWTHAQGFEDNGSNRSLYRSSNKLINEALQRGRQAKKFYEFQNTKGKVLNPEKVIGEARSEGFIIGNYTTKNVARFGDVSTTIITMSFIPRAEYPEYVFEHVKTQTSTSYEFSNLKSGICWLFTNINFIKFDNAYWTGNINNGRLHGKGIAFIYGKDHSRFIYVNGEFQNGIPLGTLQIFIYSFNSKQPEKVEFINSGSANVGQFHDDLAKFSLNGGKWGFVNNEGTIAISPTYESVIKDFSNGRAEVSKDGQEIIIGKTGNMIDLTGKQKQIDAAKKAKEQQEALQKEQERQRQEIAQRQKRIEEERQAEEREKYRKEKIRKCQPGDKIYYSKDYSERKTFFGHTYSYSTWTMRVVCFVEQNLNNGERLQIRVGNVESSNSDHYTTPEIDGMKYSKGDVFWIKPMNDSRWWVE